MMRSFTVSLNRAAGTYDICQAAGVVQILRVVPHEVTAAAGLTSVSLQSNATTPQEYLSAAEGAVANLTADKTIVNANREVRHTLLATRKLQATIVGTGSDGVMLVPVHFVPLSEDANLVAV